MCAQVLACGLCFAWLCKLLILSFSFCTFIFFFGFLRDTGWTRIIFEFYNKKKFHFKNSTWDVKSWKHSRLNNIVRLTAKLLWEKIINKASESRFEHVFDDFSFWCTQIYFKNHQSTVKPMKIGDFLQIRDLVRSYTRMATPCLTKLFFHSQSIFRKPRFKNRTKIATQRLEFFKNIRSNELVDPLKYARMWRW